MVRLRPGAKFRILAIGSSSTAGTGASRPAFAYPAQLQVDLAKRLAGGVEVENAGIGGETVSATVLRLEAALKKSKPDLVIWQVGTNDAVRGEDEILFRSLVQRGLTAAHDAKVEVMLLDPQFFPGIRNPARYERFVKIIGEIGAARSVPVFSRYALMRQWGAQSADELNAMLSKDHFHMSDRGYSCLAQRLTDIILRDWDKAARVVTGSSNAPASGAGLAAQPQSQPTPADLSGHAAAAGAS